MIQPYYATAGLRGFLRALRYGWRVTPYSLSFNEGGYNLGLYIQWGKPRPTDRRQLHLYVYLVFGALTLSLPKRPFLKWIPVRRKGTSEA